MLRCPGQDRRRLRPEDVLELVCPCGRTVELWPDEPARRCPGCGRSHPNPRHDVGCAAWCRHGRACRRGRGGA